MILIAEHSMPDCCPTHVEQSIISPQAGSCFSHLQESGSTYIGAEQLQDNTEEQQYQQAVTNLSCSLTGSTQILAPSCSRPTVSMTEGLLLCSNKFQSSSGSHDVMRLPFCTSLRHCWCSNNGSPFQRPLEAPRDL